MPTHSRRALAQGFITLLEKEGKKTAVRALAATLLVEKKPRDLPFIMCEVQKHLWLTKKELHVTVTSAHELSAALKKKLTTLLKKKYDTKSVQADFAVQPALKGGFTIDGPDSFIDASVAHQISTLKRSV